MTDPTTLILDRLQGHPDPDWYTALVCAALEETDGDLEAALDLADAAAEEHQAPTEPDTDADLSALGWLEKKEPVQEEAPRGTHKRIVRDARGQIVEIIETPIREGWDEQKHPRDHGKFSSKPGAGAEGEPANQEAKELKGVIRAKVESAEPIKNLIEFVGPREDHVYRFVTKEDYDSALATGEFRTGRSADHGGTVNFSKEPIPVYGGAASNGHVGLLIEVPEDAFNKARIHWGSKDLYLESSHPVPFSSVSRAWGYTFAKTGILMAEITEHINPEAPLRESTDASGHEHKGKGPGGGQFTAGGEGESGEEQEGRPHHLTVGENFPSEVLHGTTGKSAKAFLANTDLPDRERNRTLNEYGGDVIFTAEHDNPHQALMFSSGRSGGGARHLIALKLKPGSKVLNLASYMVRRPKIGSASTPVLEIQKPPPFTSDMAKWLNEAREKKGLQPLSEEAVDRAVNPQNPNFDTETYAGLLPGYAKDRGFAAFRLTDETVIVDRTAVEGARKVSKKERETAEQTSASKRHMRSHGGLYTHKVEGESSP